MRGWGPKGRGRRAITLLIQEEEEDTQAKRTRTARAPWEALALEAASGWYTRQTESRTSRNGPRAHGAPVQDKLASQPLHKEGLFINGGHPGKEKIRSERSTHKSKRHADQGPTCRGWNRQAPEEDVAWEQREAF